MTPTVLTAMAATHEATSRGSVDAIAPTRALDEPTNCARGRLGAVKGQTDEKNAASSHGQRFF
ncbi:hypothetical protein BA896_018750 [Janthinobacterium lividum]|jgi:hypothetical protein|uniref:Uncharacterized protein n=1 Tax=Janthinobacterium lividum TaxID=29581 RepID=A0A1E8PL35_9BURK|nr:hypothetical protein BA896_018750 [Janthinobacterium lividum]